MRRHRCISAALAVAALALAAPATAGAAEAFYGVTAENQLVIFHSDSPGSLRRAVPVTGLQGGESLIGLDVRPATGQLYALGTTSRVYVINPASGAAKAVGNPFAPPLAGTNFGFDFNPALDRIRLTSDGRQNLRLSPDDGQVAGDDNPIAYADGDPGAGGNPSPAAAAYTPEAATRLFVIDSARDVLTLQNPPNDGKLATVGPLGIGIEEPVAFDIAADGRAWAAGASGRSSTLYLIDLASGRAIAGARQPGVSAAFGALRGMAAAGPVPDDKRRPSVVVALDQERSTSALRQRLGVTVSCSEACEITGIGQRGSQTFFSRAAGSLPTAGRVTLKLRPTARARSAGATRVVVRVTVRDAAGNRVTVRRSVRFA